MLLAFVGVVLAVVSWFRARRAEARAGRAEKLAARADKRARVAEARALAAEQTAGAGDRRPLNRGATGENLGWTLGFHEPAFGTAGAARKAQ